MVPTTCPHPTPKQAGTPKLKSIQRSKRSLEACVVRLPLTPTLSRRERADLRPTFEVRSVPRLTHRGLRHPLSLRERSRVSGNLSDISNLMSNSPDTC